MLSNASGQKNNIGKNAAFRQFRVKAEADQIITRVGLDVKAFGKCLTPHFYKPTENRILTWWNCGDKKAAQWRFRGIKVKTKTTTRTFKVRLFRIRNWANKKVMMYMSDQVQGKDSFIAKLSAKKHDWRSIFFYDARSKTVRVWKRSTLVLGNQLGQGIVKGKNAAFRKFNGKAQADQAITFQGRFVKTAKYCLTPHYYKADENRALTWWDCGKNPAQQWAWAYFGPKGGQTTHKTTTSSRQVFKVMNQKDQSYQLYMSRSMQGKGSYIA